MSARKRHLLFYIGLAIIILAGNVIRNCVASPAPPICRVTIERLPTVNNASSATEAESGLQRFLAELQEGSH
jgi:hypothetical protein